MGEGDDSCLGEKGQERGYNARHDDILGLGNANTRYDDTRITTRTDVPRVS